MQPVFDIAFAAVVGVEGELSGDPLDRGGLTKFGISARAYPNLDIRNLTLDQAKQIYRSDYWNPCRADEFAPELAICLFDSAVNQGLATAVRILQSALRIAIDGKVGPLTVQTAKELGHEATVRFMAERASNYAHTLDFERFGLGWLRRLMLIYDVARTYVQGGTR